MTGTAGLRELLTAGSQGLWAAYHATVVPALPDGSPNLRIEERIAGCHFDADATLIVALRNQVPALLDCVEELRRHACPGRGFHSSPHLMSSDEGTSYCRACEALGKADSA